MINRCYDFIYFNDVNNNYDRLNLLACICAEYSYFPLATIDYLYFF